MKTHNIAHFRYTVQRRGSVWRAAFAGLAIAIGFCLAPAAQSQQLDIAPWPNDLFGIPLWPGEPAFVDLVIGWDGTSMTEAEKDALSVMENLHSRTDAEVLAQLTPEQQADWLKERLALTDPVQYTKTYSAQKTPEDLADEEFHDWAITHPIEYQKLTDKLKSKQQLQQEAISMWMITHPEETSKLAEALKSPEEKEEQRQAVNQIANPETKPKAIVITVPTSEVMNVLYGSAPQNRP